MIMEFTYFLWDSFTCSFFLVYILAQVLTAAFCSGKSFQQCNEQFPKETVVSIKWMVSSQVLKIACGIAFQFFSFIAFQFFRLEYQKFVA